MGRAPRKKETLPYFHEWCRVTRHPLLFRRLKGHQRTPGIGVSQIYNFKVFPYKILLITALVQMSGES